MLRSHSVNALGRARNMGPQYVGGGPGFMSLDRINDGAVLFYRVKHLPMFDGQQIAKPVELCFVALDQHPDPAHLIQFEKCVVERIVEFQKVKKIICFQCKALARDQASGGREIKCLICAKPLDQGRLKIDAQEMCLPHRDRIEGGDESCELGRHMDKSVLRKLLNRIAHRRSAGAISFAQFPIVENGSRRQLKRKNPTPEVGVDTV